MEKQKVWLVCGANEGLKEATVRFLLLRHQTVVAITAPGENENKTLQLYHDQFPTADLRIINIFSAPDTEQAVLQIVQQYGRIDRLVNIGDSGLLSMHVLTVMQGVGQGHIIQLSSGGSEDDCLKQPSALQMRYNAENDEGVHYTFLGPDLCFQSMLTHQTGKNYKNRYQ